MICKKPVFLNTGFDF